MSRGDARKLTGKAAKLKSPVKVLSQELSEGELERVTGGGTIDRKGRT
jgi:hypothetical protein